MSERHEFSQDYRVSGVHGLVPICEVCNGRPDDPIHAPREEPLATPSDTSEGQERETDRLGRLATLFHARHRNHEFSFGCSPCCALDRLIREQGGEPTPSEEPALVCEVCHKPAAETFVQCLPCYNEFQKRG